MHESDVVGKIVLIVLGAILLAISIFPIRKVSSLSPNKKLRIEWDILSTLVVCFIGGYLYYGHSYMHNNNSGFELIVPFIFFFGGVFVLLVGLLASQTAKDIIKMATLEHDSTTDALMEINNRRCFDKKIEEEISVALRYNSPLSLLMLDIDYFKKVNDTYGHLAGDEVLKELSNNIKEVARKSDILARYGGEEIAIIATNTDKNKALILAKRINKSIEKLVIEKNNQKIKVTVSIGVSSLNEDSVLTSETLIAKADEALYKAKEEGRNRVVSA